MVIENGTIADIGSHDDLMSRLGTYRRLYDLQFVDLETPKVTTDEARQVRPHGGFELVWKC